MEESKRVELSKALRPFSLVEEESGLVINLMPKVFSTGGIGWHHSSKITVQGQRVQVNICASIVGSKPDSVQKDTPAGSGQNEPETPQGLFEVKKGSTSHRRSKKRV